MANFISDAKIAELKLRLKGRFPSDIAGVISEFVGEAIDAAIADEVDAAITAAIAAHVTALHP
jgi:hypothetical protein